MKRNNILEQTGILSLSLLLTSSIVISGALPAMLEQFKGYSRSSVESLVTVPTVAMMIMIALSPAVSKLLSERVIIVLGLIIIGSAGIAPFFTTSYIAVMVTRILLGIGLGLINTRAVSIIGERYTGETRARLLGFRMSAETIGQTVLTLIVGQLIHFTWRASFLVYGFAFIVLFLYLAFVPNVENVAAAQPVEEDKNRDIRRRMTGKELSFTLLCAILCALLIATAASNSLRIPSYVVELGIASAVEGNMILGASTFSGFLSGVVFGKVQSRFRDTLLPCFLSVSAVGLIMIGATRYMAVIVSGAVISGFAITCCTSYVFTRLSESVETGFLNTANTIVLVGCNLGGAMSPFILKAIGVIHADLSTSFFAYAIVLLCIAAGKLCQRFARKERRYV